MGFDPRLVIVRSNVLLDFQLNAVTSRTQANGSKGAGNRELANCKAVRPVAVDVHIAREQRAMVSPDRDDEHGLDQLTVCATMHAHRKRLRGLEALGWPPAAIKDVDALRAQERIA